MVKGSNPSKGKRFIYSPKPPDQPALGSTQTPIQWVPEAHCLMVYLPQHDADISPPSSVEIKYEWSYTSTPTYVFMACVYGLQLFPVKMQLNRIKGYRTVFAHSIQNHISAKSKH